MALHIYELSDADLAAPSLVTIGVFDGVHLGHQHLIRRLTAEAQQQHLASVVLTFFPHPDVVLRGQQGRYYLTTPQERAALLGNLGVDLVVTHPFNEEVRHIRAAEFVDRLLKHLQMRALWVGQDFVMGYKREGNVAFLQEQGQAKDFTVQVIDLLYQDGSGRAISSTAIREALGGGDVRQAARWLGRFYAASGEVVHGDHRGRTIGFPTANLDIWEEKVLPENGVYACWAYLGDQRLMAVTNIGVRPTFEGSKLMVEAHLLDYSGDIYGQTLRLEFVERLRGEKRFDGVEALVAQISRDAEAGRTILTALQA